MLMCDLVTMLTWIISALLVVTCLRHKVGSQCVKTAYPNTPAEAVTVKSPNFPQGYSSNLSCEWKFALNTRYSVKLMQIEFVTFQLEESSGCSKDYLEILSASPTEGWSNLETIGRWCNGFPKYLHVFSDLAIRFHSDSNGNGKGFQLRILPQQDFVNNAYNVQVSSSTVGYLYSPGYPLGYPDNVRGAWQLEAPYGEHVQVESIDMNLKDPKCTSETLDIRGAGNTTVRRCSNQGVFATSTGNVLDIQFSSDTGGGRGFVLKYYTANPQNTTCIPYRARTVSATKKPSLISLYVPGYSTSCSWKIKAGADEVVVLETVNWEKKKLSCTETIAVYDGSSRNDKRILAASCPPGRPFGMIRSSGQYLYLSTVSDAYATRTITHGFTIKFSSRNKLDLTEDFLHAINSPSIIWIPALSKSTISSPHWKIHAAEQGKCVFAQAQNEFRHPVDGSFQQYFTAYDGVGTSAQVLKICEPYRRSFVRGSQQSIKIQVDSNSKTGFFLTYYSTETCDNQIIERSALYTFPGVIKFPADFSSVSSYPANTICRWKILSTFDADVIGLESVDTRLEPSVGCNKDYLKVFDGENMEVPLETWCARSKPNITSTASNVLLVFRSDATGTGQGFKIRYQRKGKAICRNALRANLTSKYLSSPGYPLPYSNNFECTWHITATELIKLEIRELSLYEDHCKDYVDIYDGSNRYFLSHRLARYCGSSYITSSLTSTGPDMYIVFKTDYMRTSKGFKFAYYSQAKKVPTTTCNRRLIAMPIPKTLTSPNYPSIYSTNLYCVWHITSDMMDSVISLEVMFSNVESHMRRCPDAVRVYDGIYTSSPLLGQFCGSETPTYQSTGPFMLVTFTSDSVSTYNTGFKLIYHFKREVDACSNGHGKLTATLQKKTFTSPNYPMPYENNMRCEWRIQAVNRSYVVQMRVLDSDLEYSYVCKLDYVRVYDGSGVMNRELGRWCGQSIPRFVSKGTYLTLVFRSDEQKTYTGFKIQYWAVPRPTSANGKSSGANTVALVGGVMGGVAALLIMVICLFCLLGRKKGTPRSQRSSNPVVVNRTNSTVYVVSPVYVSGNNHVDLSAPPPPYPGLTNPVYMHSPEDDLPPSYPATEYGTSGMQSDSGITRQSLQGDEIQSENEYAELNVADENDYSVPNEMPPPPPYTPRPDQEEDEPPPAYEHLQPHTRQPTGHNRDRRRIKEHASDYLGPV